MQRNNHWLNFLSNKFLTSIDQNACCWFMFWSTAVILKRRTCPGAPVTFWKGSKSLRSCNNRLSCLHTGGWNGLAACTGLHGGWNGLAVYTGGWNGLAGGWNGLAAHMISCTIIPGLQVQARDLGPRLLQTIAYLMRRYLYPVRLRCQIPCSSAICDVVSANNKHNRSQPVCIDLILST